MMPLVVFSTPATLFPLFFSILLVMPQVIYPNTNCSTNTTNYTVRSQFKRNVKALLFGSPYNNSGDSIFSNAIEADDPDKVYGLFLCEVGVTPKMCQICVDSARSETLKQCTEAVIWYDPCSISYSNRPFFSDETSQVFCNMEGQPAREPDKFNEVLGSMFDHLSIVATSNPSRPMNATTNVNFSSRSLNGMVKCKSDLSTMDCRNCLSDAVAAIPNCTRGSWVQRVTPSCIVTYELNGVYHDAPVAAEAPVPAEAPSAIRRTDNRSGGWKVKAITITISISTFVVMVLLGSCIHYRRKRTGKEIVKEILKERPNFASKTDSHGCSPLHLACSKGHLETTRELLRLYSDLSSLQDYEGRIPFHWAAIKGRVNNVDEILSMSLESAEMVELVLCWIWMWICGHHL
ncbi:Cysteine-rich receptor-like protein kinase 25 [Camellia lanceoleosa]|uniref:Cysteine-rich receptor-like protein kinase 25 n=1 Tax=Camellia lanceoleosa TaxID=1840588 RepID=A0ACC0GJF1_9ERIC|nr:Cysteine-rich receptor-like protein kinase 25 [Camellia lanceoleosa]